MGEVLLTKEEEILAKNTELLSKRPLLLSKHKGGVSKGAPPLPMTLPQDVTLFVERNVLGR